MCDSVIQFAQLVPEEQTENGMWSEPEIGSPQAFVESCQALCPHCLGEAVHVPPVELALAQAIHRLVVKARAHHVEGCHGEHHHHAGDHARGQRHQQTVF